MELVRRYSKRPEVIKPNEALLAFPACHAWPMALNAIETLRGWRAVSDRCARCNNEEHHDVMFPLNRPVQRSFSFASKGPTSK